MLITRRDRIYVLGPITQGPRLLQHPLSVISNVAGEIAMNLLWSAGTPRYMFGYAQPTLDTVVRSPGIGEASWYFTIDFYSFDNGYHVDLTRLLEVLLVKKH